MEKTINTLINKYNYGLSLGTYELVKETDKCQKVIEYGLSCGYRSIDTAQMHNDHKQIAEGLHKAYISIPGLKRTDIFITTKLHNNDQRLHRIAEALEQMFLDLRMEYIDCVLLHSPIVTDTPESIYIESWIELTKYWQANGNKIRHIGVSNFNTEQLEKIYEATQIKPFVNQFEIHPRNYSCQLDTIEYCRKNDIIVQSHSSIKPYMSKFNVSIDEENQPKFIIDEDTLVEKLMTWFTIHKIPMIIKSENFDHIKENFDVWKNLENKDFSPKTKLDVEKNLRNNDKFTRLKRYQYYK